MQTTKRGLASNSLEGDSSSSQGKSLSSSITHEPEKNGLYQIYCLSDSRDQTIRYVGVSKDAQVRFKQHLRKKGNAPSAWIADLAAQQLEPVLTVIETVDGEQEAKKQEKYWIQHFANLGHPLVNKCHNEDALYERAREEALHVRLVAHFAHLPQEQANTLIEITQSAYKLVGYCAWDSTLETVQGTIQQLQAMGYQLDLDEVAQADITLRLFGYRWR